MFRERDPSEQDVRRSHSSTSGIREMVHREQAESRIVFHRRNGISSFHRKESPVRLQGASRHGQHGEHGTSENHGSGSESNQPAIQGGQGTVRHQNSQGGSSSSGLSPTSAEPDHGSSGSESRNEQSASSSSGLSPTSAEPDHGSSGSD